MTELHVFESKEAAVECNSHCSFCGLLKFIIAPIFETVNRDIFTETIHKGYTLVRCDVPDCDIHCKFNHSLEVNYHPLADHEDVMKIVRG